MACDATTLLRSDFETGDQSWTVGEFFNSTHGWLPTYVPFGGVDGSGYIETSDVYGFNAFHAPTSWLGDQSRLYGAKIRIQQKVLSADGRMLPLIGLVSGATKLQFRTPPPGTDWTTYQIPLIASAGWEIANGSGDSGPAATEEDLRRVLSNLQWLAINADWQAGNDIVSMDNVYVGMPEPASIALSASALATLAFFHRRRRRAN
ncbi:MAG TPA: laminin B domain-containing protein [Bryobacteraceae bacterium]|nr:laminin B domain-containing protein [Bryobacteraceae bacterium]